MERFERSSLSKIMIMALYDPMTVPASVIYDADAYPEFRSWFVKTVFEVFDSFSPPLRQEIEMMTWYLPIHGRY